MVVEETEKARPLTPDGNAALVDDFGGNKQLITVTTKAGNYFYILIDRANEDKETAVHFLNQVDEADLMALMEDGKYPKRSRLLSVAVRRNVKQVQSIRPARSAQPIRANVREKAGTGDPGRNRGAGRTGEKPAGLNPAILFLLLALLGGGGVFAYFKLVKNKPKTKGNDSLDDYDYGEEDTDQEDGTPRMRSRTSRTLTGAATKKARTSVIDPFHRQPL